MEDSRASDNTVHAGDQPASDTACESQPDERENTLDQDLRPLFFVHTALQF